MMGRKAVSTALLLAVVLALWSAPWRTDSANLAHAGEADDVAAARALLEDGDDFLARGERLERRGQRARAFALYREALARYQKAYKLVPKPTIFFAIAGAEAKLDRYLDAIEHYQRVVAEVADAGLREQAQARIRALSARVAILELDVQPAGAAIAIDREPRGQAPIEGPIYLAAGEHTITVTAEGYTPFEESFMLRAGKPVRREIELADVTMLVKAPKPVQMGAAPVTPADTRPAPSKTVVVVGTTLTLALAAGATATGILALRTHDEFEADGLLPDRRGELADRGRTLALTTDGLAIGAVLVGSYTLYRYLGVYRPARAAYDEQRAMGSRASDAIWIAPYAGAHGGGLAVGGRF